MTLSNDDLRQEMILSIQRARVQFELDVDVVCNEISTLARELSSALGEVSIGELRSVIIREFSQRLGSKQ